MHILIEYPLTIGMLGEGSDVLKKLSLGIASVLVISRVSEAFHVGSLSRVDMGCLSGSVG